MELLRQLQRYLTHFLMVKSTWPPPPLAYVIAATNGHLFLYMLSMQLLTSSSKREESSTQNWTVQRWTLEPWIPGKGYNGKDIVYQATAKGYLGTLGPTRHTSATLLRRFLAKTVCPQLAGLLNAVCPRDSCTPFFCVYRSLNTDIVVRVGRPISALHRPSQAAVANTHQKGALSSILSSVLGDIELI